MPAKAIEGLPDQLAGISEQQTWLNDSAKFLIEPMWN
jgi:hypothetical protein